jgi:hypothetical protein
MMHAVALPQLSRFRSSLRRVTVLLCLAYFATLGLGVRSAHAQSDGETEVARQRFREGVRHYDQQEYDKARLAFLQAYLLKPHPAVLLNLAQSELRAGRYAEAAENFARYIRQNPTAPAMDHAKASFEEARQKVAELNVQVNVTAAIISIDGAEAGRSPLAHALYLMPGRHVVSARKAGVSADRTLDAVAGQRVYVTLELEEGYATGPAVATAPVATTGDAGSALGADRNVQATSEPGVDGQAPQGFFAWLSDTPGAIATVSVAGLALGTSAVLAAFASNRYAAANDARDQITRALRTYVDNGVLVGTAVPCGEDGIANRPDSFDSRVSPDNVAYLTGAFANACTRFSERSDSGDNLKTLSLVSLGVGAFATVGTVVWYFSDRNATSGTEQASFADKHRARISPILSPETQGIWFSATF